jgi:hypothetical protein
MSEFDLNDDEETKLIDDIARMIVDRGLETPAIMLLEVARPISFIASQLAVVTLSPLLWLFELEGSKYTAVFMKRGNVERIINRIETLTMKTTYSGLFRETGKGSS